MNTIINYVETMFMNLPDNEEISEMKQEILTNMEEKYYELSEDGLSENEAIGLVISEFGNIDELMTELDVRKNKKEELTVNTQLDTLSIHDIDEYIAMRRSIGVGIGLGVILCGIAASMVIFGEYLNMIIAGLIPGILIIAIAVALFIVNGIKHSKFEYLEKGFFLDPSNHEYLEIENKNNEKSFVVSLIIGISLCIVSAIPVLIGSQQTKNILLYTCMTIIIAVIGCFFLIYGGNVKGAYTFLLENGIDSSISHDELESKLFWKKINNSFWLVVVGIYLLISFLFNNWHLSWLIFPLAAAVSSVFPYSEE